MKFQKNLSRFVVFVATTLLLTTSCEKPEDEGSSVCETERTGLLKIKNGLDEGFTFFLDQNQNIGNLDAGETATVGHLEFGLYQITALENDFILSQDRYDWWVQVDVCQNKIEVLK